MGRMKIGLESLKRSAQNFLVMGNRVSGRYRVKRGSD